MKVRQILETALYAENLEETAVFYERVLGLERFENVPGRLVFFKLEGHMLLLFNPAATAHPEPDAPLPVPTHGASGEGHVCFTLVPGEAQSWCDHLASVSVEIEADFMWPDTNARSIYFRDPAGNSVELGERTIWF